MTVSPGCSTLLKSSTLAALLEHKMLYLRQTGPVPEAPYAIPLGKVDIKPAGRDVTIVATQAMVARTLTAATQLEREGISAEVIDPRTLRPLGEATILQSVRKTGRMFVVLEACTTGGWGGEIAAIMMENAFDRLDAPVIRVGSLDMPMPFNDLLETAVIPSVARIVDAVRGLF